jgi:hypothetical protein
LGGKTKSKAKSKAAKENGKLGGRPKKEVKMITLETIKALKPCKDRLDNYVKHYSEKSFTHGQFMGLKNITPEDKIWAALRLMPQAKLRFAAADIAESVLDIYEAKYPNDNRPRLAIEAARNGSADDARAAAAAHDVARACGVKPNHEKVIRKIILRYWK